MRRLTLGEWSSLAEVVASTGVIVSLVFVAHTVRQNTREVRAAQADLVHAASREIEMAVAADSEWSRILVEATRGGSLAPEEWYRYDAYVVSHLDLWDQLLSRHAEGLIDPSFFDGWNVYFEDFVERHVTEEVWARIEWQWPLDPFRSRVREVVSRGSAP
jgi:hypothetical protein